MKTLPVLVLGIFVIIVVGLLAIMTETARQPTSMVVATSSASTTNTGTSTESDVFACNGDGFICPDGSMVGRIGSACVFAACPPQNSTTTIILTTLGQKKTGLNVSLTPLEIVEDSRCPSDVQCIWAGTVKVRTKIESALGSSEMVLELGQSVTTEAEEITLLEVWPGKSSADVIPVSSYRLTFDVKKR